MDRNQGGELLSWALEHVDSAPSASTTATYLATVRWPHGERTELLGVSARTGELSPTDERAHVFEDGTRRVAVWLYPDDPDLPGLPRAAYPDRMAEALAPALGPLAPEQVSLTMIGYRPRRRAVVRVDIAGPAETLYVKVLRPRIFADVLRRHTLLREGGIPATWEVVTLHAWGFPVGALPMYGGRDTRFEVISRREPRGRR